jgi:hypothetical protein
MAMAHHMYATKFAGGWRGVTAMNGKLVLAGLSEVQGKHTCSTCDTLSVVTLVLK